MDIAIITQEDHFVIPRNLEKIRTMPDINIKIVVTADVKGALVNRKAFFAKGFGLWQASNMAFHLLLRKAADRIDRIFGCQMLRRKNSIFSFAHQHNIPHYQVVSVNSDELINKLKQVAPDLIVSFSAPCVFKSELLNVAPKGCINLHCSALPRYAGLLPSFWVLYKGEKETGVTVHYMDDKIDNGEILSQRLVPIDHGMSMFQLIDRTKLIGGKLICEVIHALQTSNPISRPNYTTNKDYYSWPTIEQMREFRKTGGRFI